MPAPITPIKVVFGAMTFGDEGQEQVRITSDADAAAVLAEFAAHGHDEVDTARAYGGGSSERMLARLKTEQAGFKISTKVHPRVNEPPRPSYSHSKADIARALHDSLEALATDKVDIYYLHAPDRRIPFAETLQAIDEQFKAGRFARFGISNYPAAEVEQIVALAKELGTVQPTVYQGMYSAATRLNEPELFPVLRKHGIAFYAFSPLGGGFFTGAITTPDAPVAPGSRFDPTKDQGRVYRGRYYKPAYFEAVGALREVADNEHLGLSEIALRWIAHHSLLSAAHGDAVLVGASSLSQLKANLADLEKPVLPASVLAVLDDVWAKVKDASPPYHH